MNVAFICSKNNLQSTEEENCIIRELVLHETSTVVKIHQARSVGKQ
jgi:hypothetical protein